MPWVDGRWKGELPTIEELTVALLECDCCGSRGVEFKVYRLAPTSHHYEMKRKDDLAPIKVLCNLCSITLTGSWWEYYPRQGYQEFRVMQTLCTIGNEIIKEIRKLKT